MSNHIKQALYQRCFEDIEQRINVIEETLASIRESRNNETKSSAGDKYETGRAMMQIEEDKNRSQLAQAFEVKNELQKLDIDKKTIRVENGSLVYTSNGVYFISIGIGKVKLEDQLYYCVSRFSPIGMKLIGKRTGDEIEFNGNQIRIVKIA
jgi:hypothetical protein